MVGRGNRPGDRAKLDLRPRPEDVAGFKETVRPAIVQVPCVSKNGNRAPIDLIAFTRYYTSPRKK